MRFQSACSIEDECSDRGDRRGVLNAPKRVVEQAQVMFDLWVQFVLIAVEIDQVTLPAERFAPALWRRRRWAILSGLAWTARKPLWALCTN